MLICLRVKMGLSGLAEVADDGALVDDELEVPACWFMLQQASDGWLEWRLLLRGKKTFCPRWKLLRSKRENSSLQENERWFTCPSIMCASTIGSGEEGAEPGEGGPCWKISSETTKKDFLIKPRYYYMYWKLNVPPKQTKEEPTWPRNSRLFFSRFISSLRLLAICSGVSTDSLNSGERRNPQQEERHLRALLLTHSWHWTL